MSQPVAFQRLEAGALALASAYIYFTNHLSLWWFLGLWFAIDLSMMGYVISPKVGSLTYNLGHSLIAPAAILAAWYITGTPYLLALGLTWLNHIGVDRALGYGLKHATGFGDTHLGHIGKPKPAASTG